MLKLGDILATPGTPVPDLSYLSIPVSSECCAGHRHPLPPWPETSSSEPLYSRTCSALWALLGQSSPLRWRSGFGSLLLPLAHLLPLFPRQDNPQCCTTELGPISAQPRGIQNRTRQEHDTDSNPEAMQPGSLRGRGRQR